MTRRSSLLAIATMGLATLSVESQSQAMSGLLGTTTDCSQAARDKLSLELSLARTALADPRMLDWLKDAWVDGPENTSGSVHPGTGTGYPEWIVSRMLEGINTDVKCVANMQAGQYCAQTETELVYVDPDGLAQLDVSNPDSRVGYAAFLAHEVAHNKCLSHLLVTGDSADGSPTGAVEASVKAILKNEPDPLADYRLSTLPYETTLAPVGLDYETAPGLAGITWGDSLCRGTRVGSGLRVSYSQVDEPQGWGPDSLALLCQPQTGGCWDSLSGERGFPGSTQSLSECGCNEVMVGAYGHSGMQLKSVGALCADRSAVLAGSPVTPVLKPEYGTINGLAWTRQCPTGMMVKGIRVRTDHAISYLEVICQTLATAETIGFSSAWDGPSVGTSVSNKMWYLKRCPGHEVLAGLSVGHGDRSIRRLRGTCAAVNGSGPAATLGNLQGTIPAYGYGTYDSMDWSLTVGAEDDCPAGYALVGLSTYFDGSDPLHPLVRGIQGICAKFDTWADSQIPADSTKYPLPGRGAISEGAWHEYYCPRGSYLNGWYIAEQSGLTGIRGTCRSFAYTAPEGAPGFSSFEDLSRRWTTTGPAAIAPVTTAFTQGIYSLEFTGCSYTPITSPLFATYEFPVIGTKLAFDIRLPLAQSNWYWLGQVQMFVTIPESGIYNRFLGNVDLNAIAPAGNWKMAEFPLPDDVRNAFLTDSQANSQLVITVNPGSCLAPLKIDNVHFTGTLTPRWARSH